ncbi:MAG: 23S rRNA (adenine(2503)-C(2))-methyltransferase RlmN [Firmicutes bacterium]|nr:23S rRNA (adenine(2503)-C(2))-methyltransferase RlmN [Bacillota bacterium]
MPDKMKPAGKVLLKDLSRAELEDFFSGMGERSFRAVQLMGWLYQRQATTFDQMTDLSLKLRQKLESAAIVNAVTVARRQESVGDGTVKYLFMLGDGNTCEGVLMRHDYGNSFCVSTQVGCAMGCRFCASTLGGRIRDLSVGEIVDQVVTAQRELAAEEKRISSVVFMGTGEPLENYAATVGALRLLNSPEGLNIGYRHLTVSTSGLSEQIRRLAGEELPITLSVSLHAPNDALRSELMPVNRRFPIGELLPACRDYIQRTGRRITFEYAMMDGINDSGEQARQLAGLLRGMLCHVNLIPLNPVAERGIARSSLETVRRFQAILEEEGIETTVRREMGGDIDAACGQLRRRAMLESGMGEK